MQSLLLSHKFLAGYYICCCNCKECLPKSTFTSGVILNAQIRFLFFFLSLVLFGLAETHAQTTEDDFAKLHAELLQKYSEGDLDAALDDIQKLKRVITEKKNAAALPKVKQEELNELFKTTKSPVAIGQGDFEVKVHFGGTTLYVISHEKNGAFAIPLDEGEEPPSPYYPRPQIPVEHHGKLAVLNQFVKVGDETREILYTSSNEDIFTVSEDGIITATGDGTAVLVVSIEEATAQIPLRIVVIPVTEGMTAKEVISKLGVPDETTDDFLSSGEYKTIDGIFYSAIPEIEADKLGVQVIHWKYKKYPNAILRLSSLPKLEDCVTQSWEETDTIRYRLEQGEMKEEQDVGLPELGKRNVDITLYRTWNDKAGKHSTEAKFLEYQKGKVQLERKDGKTIELPLNQLSKEDQGWVRERLKKRREE